MVDKSTSIKGATDKQIDELIRRLRKERELQSLILDIKLRSEDQQYNSYENTKISTEEPIESLYHHGILGMKWGVRRTPAQLARASSSSGNRKSVKDMSDDELKKKVARLNLEKNYAQLTAKQKSKGQKMVAEILENSGKQVATNFVSKFMTEQIENILKKTTKG